MHKLFVRLLVACTCFVLSVNVTNFLRLFRGQVSPMPVVQVKPAVPVGNFSEDEYPIREIYREYGPAQTRHDREFFKRIEADDFRLFVSDESFSREEDIKWMESMPRDMIYENHVDFIKIFGNSAVAHGWMEVRYGDGRVEWWNYVDVWEKGEHGWKIRSTTSSD